MNKKEFIKTNFTIRGYLPCEETVTTDNSCNEAEKEELRPSIQLIPDWQNKEYRCYFCGSIKSVKYTEEIFDPVINDRGLSKVCVCNRCALLHIGK